MNKTELQQVRDALSINRVMAKDADGNYTREVTPKLITAALALIDADLARVVEPVGQVVSSGPSNFPIFQWLSADHSFRVPIGSKLYATPQDAEAKAVQP